MLRGWTQSGSFHRYWTRHPAQTASFSPSPPPTWSRNSRPTRPPVGLR